MLSHRAVLCAVIAASAGLQASSANAADGWQKVKWSIPQEKVRESYPEATSMSDKDVQDKSPRGLRCLLEMPYQAGTITFTARFCFGAENLLQSVRMDAHKPFNLYSLKQGLTDRYGKPETTETTEITDETTWRDGNTILEVFALMYPSFENGRIIYTPQSAYLSYRAATSASNSGL